MNHRRREGKTNLLKNVHLRADIYRKPDIAAESEGGPAKDRVLAATPEDPNESRGSIDRL